MSFAPVICVVGGINVDITGTAERFALDYEHPATRKVREEKEAKQAVQEQAAKTLKACKHIESEERFSPTEAID